MPFSEASLRARWKFVVAGASLVVLSEMNQLIQRGIPLTAQNVAMLSGAAIGGGLLGWVVWFFWARNQK